MLCSTLLLTTVALVVSTSTAAVVPQIGNQVSLDVYYEALCPDSAKFISNQLAPTFDSISAFTDIRLIPFGKATFQPTEDGGYSFQCQHGARECVANQWHSCGIPLSSNASQAVQFVRCLMWYPTDPAKCARETGLDFDKLEACNDGSEGIELLHQNGVETLSLQPKVTFIPWLVFNKKWTDENQENGMEDLKATVCSMVAEGTASC